MVTSRKEAKDKFTAPTACRKQQKAAWSYAQAAIQIWQIIKQDPDVIHITKTRCAFIHQAPFEGW